MSKATGSASAIGSQRQPEKVPPPTSSGGGHDAPITSVTEDCLDALRTARAIQRVIAASPRNWSTRIGLYGTWGSGKTSILNLLGELERSDGAIVVRFSAWSAAGESGVLRLFYAELARELRRQDLEVPSLGMTKAAAEKVSWIPKLFGKPPTGTDTILGLPEGTVSALGIAADLGFDWFRINRKDVEKMVASLGERRVTVFVDDLDRADPVVVPKSLLALRELLDWPRFTFVMAFDRRMVGIALSAYSEAYGDNAELFLEKVIDISFDVPSPTHDQRGRLAKNVFRVCAPFVDDITLQAAEKYLPAEPRRVKQIARKLSVLSVAVARHEPSELDYSALVLLNIVEEANSALATAVIGLASDSEKNWELLLGTEKERDQSEQNVRETLSAHVNGTDSERDRSVSAALALLRRWSSASADQIIYLTKLAYREPSFTRKEVRDIVNAWAGGSGESFDKLVNRGIAHSGESPPAACLQLLSIALSLYSESLENMASAQTEVARLQESFIAGQRLKFLEHAFTVNEPSSFVMARRMLQPVSQLVALVERWAAWTRNAGEDELRTREQQLGIVAVSACDEPEELFASTDPFWESHHDEKDGPPAQWRARVRVELLPTIVERLFAKFWEPEGVLAAARGEENLATWMLESEKSPVYTDPVIGQRFGTLFAAEGLDAARLINLRDNAKLYLRMLLHQTRDSSWGGIEKVKRIDAQLPELIPNAWNAVVRHPVPFRMLSNLRKLKKSLIDAGVNPAKLSDSDWMIRADAEIARTADSAPRSE